MELKDKTDEKLILESYEKHAERIYNISYGFVKNKKDAEDVVQETFKKAIIKIDQYTYMGTEFSTWLIKISINESIDRLRQIKKENEIIDKYGCEIHDQMDSSTFPQPDELAEKNDICNIINKEIDKLPDIFREPLKLRYYDGFDCKQISKILDIPEGTVKSRLFKGRDKLKESLISFTIIYN